MPSELDLLLGRLAVARGWVDEPRLAEATARQERERLDGRPERLLGVHLVETGDLSPDRLEQLLDAQMRAFLQAEDVLLGATLVRNGLAARAEVDRALAAQRTQIREPRRLGEILVAQGSLSPQALLAALRAQERMTQKGPASLQPSIPPPPAALPPPPAAPDTSFPSPASGAPAVAPAHFGRFEILAELGRGGMGVVYRAREPGLDREVALKTLRPDGLLTPEDVERFLVEARTLARLKHPGIVSLFESGRDGDRAWFTMPLLEGVSLAELLDGYGRIERAPSSLPEVVTEIRRRREPRPAVLLAPAPLRRPLPFLHAVTLARKILDALGYAHGNGVIHRDLKPSNIMLSEQGDPLLLDFGLARSTNGSGQGLTQTGAIMGTLAYMAPEQAGAGARRADERSDLYAAGAILYEMLAGRPAQAVTGDWVGDLARVVHEEPTPLRIVQPSVPPDLATIVHKALAKEPARRYGSCAAMAEDLRRFLAVEPISARPPELAYRARMWARRHREQAVGGTVAILAAFLAIGWIGGSELNARRKRCAELAEATEAVAHPGTDPERTLEDARRIAGAGTEPEAIDLRRRIAIAAAQRWIDLKRFDTALGALNEMRGLFPDDPRLRELYKIAEGRGSLTLDTRPSGAEVWFVPQASIESAAEDVLAAHDARMREHVRRILDAVVWSEGNAIDLRSAFPAGSNVRQGHANFALGLRATEAGVSAELPARPHGPTRILVRGRVEGPPDGTLAVWCRGNPWEERYFRRTEGRIEIAPHSTVQLRAEDALIAEAELPARAFVPGRPFELSVECAGACERVRLDGASLLEGSLDGETDTEERTGLRLEGGGLVVEEIRFDTAQDPPAEPPPEPPAPPPIPWRRLGTTPLHGTPLDIGSYLIELRRDRRVGRYPVQITRSLELDAGTVRLDLDVPPEYRFVPAGPARIGGRDLELLDFAIAAREVNKREFAEFVATLSAEESRQLIPCDWSIDEAGTHQGPEDWGYGPYDPARNPDQNEQPVSFVHLEAAKAYCAWLAGKTGRRLRLPSAEEWEKAARGVDGREYPWGRGFHRLRAKVDRIPSRYGDPEGYPLGVSPYGARHMAGQLAEWTSTWYRGERWANVVKGGSYLSLPGEARCEAEIMLSNACTREDVGFRVLLDLAAEEREGK